ncbi:MAG: aminomethyl-transferring glycine dehydrogenase subunit GcvPA [Bacillota bacterium]
MNFIPNTERDRQRMLEAIGIRSIEELFEDIPDIVRLKRELDLPRAMSESELYSHMVGLAGANSSFHEYVSFLGAGAYDHYIPAVVQHVLGRSEFYTAYTPYQPEVSQAVLQSIYEYQTMICELTGMDVSNASMYDGATAMAEAAMIACGQTRRKKIVVARSVHPEYRAVIHTYARGADLEVVEVDFQKDSGQVCGSGLAGQVPGAGCVLVQQPNFFGCIEDVQSIGNLARQHGALFVVAVDPLSLGVLRPPASYGADMVVGEGQPLGVPMSFGGPYLGFFAVTEKLMRRIPGRVVGATVDVRGQRGFVLTLQTREQHIRREKATSNICSNEALCALAATVYLSWLGKEGIQDLARHCLQKAAYARDRITSLDGYQRAFSAPHFKEFAVRCQVGTGRVLDELLKKKIIAGYPLGRDYPELDDVLLISVTEKRSRGQIDALVSGLEGLA